MICVDALKSEENSVQIFEFSASEKTECENSSGYRLMLRNMFV